MREGCINRVGNGRLLVDIRGVAMLSQEEMGDSERFDALLEVGVDGIPMC